MPALAKTHRILPRFVPHYDRAEAGAGISFKPESAARIEPSPISGQNPRSESLDRLAHDARNVFSGLMLYSELLAGSGVLNPPHGHYAGELDGMIQTAARILEKILAEAIPKTEAAPKNEPPKPVLVWENAALPAATAVPLAPVPVSDLAAELRHLRPLLAAIAGPAVRLSVAAMPCAGCTALAVEDLTRVLINLVRNAADAMPRGGHVRITAQYHDGLSFAPLPEGGADAIPTPRAVLLTVSDDGPGVPEALREQIFDLGFTTRKQDSTWPAPRRRGLGLGIVRNLVESAGGSVRLTSSHGDGARFEIVLPLDAMVTSGTYSVPPSRVFSADSREEGCIECQ
jgi:signal transduction histidine kinase